MMKIIVFLLLIFTSASSYAVDEFCQNQLNQQIKKLIETDKDLITDLYQLSQMKLTAKLLADPGKQKTLEEHIADKLKDLPQERKKKIESEILTLYKDYGLKLTQDEAKHVLDEMESARYSSPNTRLKGIKGSVAIHLLRKLQDHEGECLSGLSCLDKKDEAINWLVGEVRKSNDHLPNVVKNLMDTSTIVAHYSGYVNPAVMLTGEEAAIALADLEDKINSTLNGFMLEFKNKVAQCAEVFGSDKCFKKAVDDSLATQIKELIKSVSQGEAISIDRKSNQIVLDSMRLNFGLSNQYLTKLKAQRDKEARNHSSVHLFNTPSEEEAGDDNGPLMCEGKEFKSEIKDKKVWGIMDPRGDFKAQKKAWDAYKKGGIKGLTKLNRKNSRIKSGGSNKVGEKILNKFKIPGPFFRCGLESPIAIPKLGLLSAQKKVCCRDEEQWRRLQYIFLSFGGGLTCRFFFGLPYIAEIGAKLGMGVNIFLSGGVEPDQCDKQSCVTVTPSFNVSVGLYAEILSGAGGLQGTISFVPYASVKQCFGGPGGLPPALVSYKVGRLLFIGTARVGWAFSFSTVKTIYESNKTNNTAIPIF
jgi:ribosomal protein S25